MSMCQCAGCGRTFTSLTAFDRHQDWNYKRRPMLVCRDPSDAGLIQGNDGRWRLPLSTAGRVHYENLAAQKEAS